LGIPDSTDRFITKDRQIVLYYRELPYRKFNEQIIRHTKIRSKYNPFDPEWEVYSEERTGKLMQKKFKKAKRLLKIWKNQRSRCPGCGERITTETGWNLHHIIRRVDGGTEELSNLMLLHPNCHRQLHHGNNVAGSLKRA